MLSNILNKATFWKTHAGIAISERQQTILNIFLDGYEGKLTAKNWSKLALISLDTASRDIKDLVTKGIISPVQGRVRDISYTLNYIATDIRTRDFINPAIVQHNGEDYITTLYKGHKYLEEKITSLDLIRFKQNEITINDLVYKYFAYLTEL